MVQLILLESAEGVCSLCWSSGFLKHLRSLSMVNLYLYQLWSLTHNFYNLDTNNLYFLWNKTRCKWSLFCYARRNFFVRISIVFVKALVQCWYVQITVVYLSTLQKSSQVSQIFAIFTKLYESPYKCFCLIGETWCKRNKYLCLFCGNKCSWEAIFFELSKISKPQNFWNLLISCVWALLRHRFWIWVYRSTVSLSVKRWFTQNSELAFQFFHQKGFFGKVFYLLIHVVIVSLLLAIIK